MFSVADLIDSIISSAYASMFASSGGGASGSSLGAAGAALGLAGAAFFDFFAFFLDSLNWSTDIPPFN